MSQIYHDTDRPSSSRISNMEISDDRPASRFASLDRTSCALSVGRMSTGHDVSIKSDDGPTKFSKRKLWLIFSALIMAMFMAALDQTVISVAMPNLVADFGRLDIYAWVMASYLLTSSSCMPIYGKFSDIFGRKIAFQIGMGIFTVASAFGGAAQTMYWIIIARAIQGMGGAGLISMTTIIIGDMVSPRDRGFWQGMLGGVYALGTVVGPLVGGFFVDNISWRWLFFINIPIGVIGMTVAQLNMDIPNLSAARNLSWREKAKMIDYVGTVLVICATSCFVCMVTWGGIDYPWDSMEIIGLGIGAALLFGVFLINEHFMQKATEQSESPELAPQVIMPLRMFKYRDFVVCTFVQFFIALGLFGVVGFLPVYFQIVRGDTGTVTGLKMVPLMVSMMLAMGISGNIMAKYEKYRWSPLCGGLVLGCGIYGMTTLSYDMPYGYIAVFLMLMGMGNGMAFPVTLTLIQTSVPDEDMAAATAGAFFIREIGGGIGISIYGSILNNQLASELKKAFGDDLPDGAENYNYEQALEMGIEWATKFWTAYANALGNMFMYGMPFVGATIILALFVRHHKLSTEARILKGGANPVKKTDRSPLITEGCSAEGEVSNDTAYTTPAH